MNRMSVAMMAALLSLGVVQQAAFAAQKRRPSPTPTPPAIELTAQLAERLGATQFVPVDSQHSYRSLCVEEREAATPYRSLNNWTHFDAALARGHWVGEYRNGSWINTHAFVLYAAPTGGITPDPKAPGEAGNPASFVGTLGASHYVVAHPTDTNIFQYRMYCLTDGVGNEPLALTEWGNFDQARRIAHAHRDHKKVLVARPTPQ